MCDGVVLAGREEIFYMCDPLLVSFVSCFIGFSCFGSSSNRANSYILCSHFCPLFLCSPRLSSPLTTRYFNAQPPITVTLAPPPPPRQDKIKLIAQVELLQSDLLRAKSYVRERDREIAERQRELADSTHAAAEKEKFRKILTARIEQLEQREGPAMDYMTDLTAYIATLEGKNGELFVELRAAAQRTQNEKDKSDSLRAQMRVQHEAVCAKNLLVDGVMGELGTPAIVTRE